MGYMPSSPLSYQNYQTAVPALQAGELAVLPTDTIYGVVCRALDPAAVERLFEIKQRSRSKPCIVLLADREQLMAFGVELTLPMEQVLFQVWPGPVSVAVLVSDAKWSYLHGGTGSLAFRVPHNSGLSQLITTTGPLLAPSANPEGLEPAITISGAKAYFGDSVAAYVDGGEFHGTPSRLIALDTDGSYDVLRQ